MSTINKLRVWLIISFLRWALGGTSAISGSEFTALKTLFKLGNLSFQPSALYKDKCSLGKNLAPWKFDKGPSGVSHNPCSERWLGVECKGSKVVKLCLPGIFSSKQEFGMLLLPLVKLTSLSYLNLRSNDLHGILASTISNLKALTYLDIRENSLSGTISSTSLNKLTDLEVLLISSNKFSGTIPDLSTFPSLGSVYLDNNRFLGGFPALSTSITDIDFSYNSLSGPLDSNTFSGFADNLESLLIQNNSFSGTLPSSIFSVSLSALDVSSNRFEGTISTAIGDLMALISLNLFSNHFRGTIPESLGKLTDLETLDLHDNSLSGTFPTSFSEGRKLKYIDLSSNRLVAIGSGAFSNKPDLDTLFISGNSISGPLPSEIFSASSITSLKVDNNNFKGPLTFATGQLKLLVDFIAFNNKLSGSIPDGLTDLKNLQRLMISNNTFKSTLPTKLGSMSSLQVLDLGRNSFYGSIPSELGSLKLLVVLWLNNNNLYGGLPSLSGCTSLVTLKLDTNDLVGTLPHSWMTFSELKQLSVWGNSLSGTIPSDVCNLKKLIVLAMNANLFSGTLPNCLVSLSSLRYLMLHNNSFSGEIPSLSENLQSSLQGITLTANKLTGTIPPSLFKERSNLTFMTAGSNCLSGALPSSICSATALEVLNFDGLSAGSSCRKLIWPLNSTFNATIAQTAMVGTIPSCIFQLPRLRTLTLSGNGLEGTLPDSLPISLMSVILSHNRLSGVLPNAMQLRLFDLQVFDVSHNRLQGRLTENIPFSNATSAHVKLFMNRLSGPIPEAFEGATHLEILEGNTFSCGVMPINDPYLSSAQCGSKTLNTYVACFLGLVAILFSIQLLAPRFERFPPLSVLHDVYSVILGSAQLLEGTSRVDVLLGFLGRFSCIAAAFHTILLIPLYAILTTFCSSQAESYIFTLSAAFKFGPIAAATLIVFWSLLVTAGDVYLDINSHCHTPSGRVEAKKSNKPTVTNQLPLQALLLMRPVFVLILNIIVVATVNAIFVTISLAGTVEQQTMAQISMSVFNVAMNKMVPVVAKFRFFLPKDAVEMFSQKVFGGEQFILLLSIVNNSFAPLFVTFFTDRSCLKNLLIEADKSHSIFSFEAAFTLELNDSLKHVASTFTFGTLFNPSFDYGYQCTSLIARSYLPVFMFSAIQNIIITICSVARMRLKWGSLNTFPYDGFDIFGECVVELLTISTFGTVFPLLSLAQAAVILSKGFSFKYVATKWCNDSSKNHVSIEDQSATFLASSPILTLRWFLLGSASVFLTIYIIDTSMVGDETTNTLWAPVTMLILPLLLCLTCHFSRRSSYFKSAVRKAGSSNFVNDDHHHQNFDSTRITLEEVYSPSQIELTDTFLSTSTQRESVLSDSLLAAASDRPKTEKFRLSSVPQPGHPHAPQNHYQQGPGNLLQAPRRKIIIHKM